MAPDDEILTLIGDAAEWAALVVSQVGPDAMEAGCADTGRLRVGMVETLRRLGPVPTEAVFRQAAADGLHIWPADGFDALPAALRTYFLAFAAVTRALIIVLAPPRRDAAPLVPVPYAPRLEDTIFAPLDARDARQMSGTGRPGALSTADVPVTRPVPSTALVPAAGAAPLQIGPAQLEAFAAGRPPTHAEFLAMTPEERRPWAAVFGGLPVFTAESGMAFDPAPAPTGPTRAVATEGATMDGVPVAGVVPVTPA